MSPSNALAGTRLQRVDPTLPGTSISSQCGEVVSLESFELYICESRSRHHHNVQRSPVVLDLIQTKDLTNETLGTVSAGRAPKPARGYDSQPSDLLIVREHENREVSPPCTNASLLYP